MAECARISVTELCVRKGTTDLIKDLSLAVRPGEILGLIGPNGAGKSTLLSCIAGIESSTSGHISIDGKALGALKVSERARTIAWLEQSGSMHWPLSVERIVMLGRLPHLTTWGQPVQSDTYAVENALRQTDCVMLRKRRFPSLSGGEQSRVLLARALATQASLLLADEPVASLDLKHQLQTMQVLRAYAHGNNSVVVVLHDLSLAARFCDRLLLMNEGRAVALGETRHVLNKENIATVYGVSVVIGNEPVPWIVAREML
ncbi:MAG: ABC transporter ATP-binding protein [Granulosicoccus sp.]|nr:ABC transporter ATP-binding protein [Granulosicoccus sp.]